MSLNAGSTEARHPYTFHVGVSWSGLHAPMQPFPSDHPIGRWRDKVISRWKSVPGTDPGEDFWFVQEMKNRSGLALGVADGVGAWSTKGVDPALFSQTLMYNAHRYSSTSWAGEPETDPTFDHDEQAQVEGSELTPLQCMDLAYGSVLRERYVDCGSSTACLLTLNAASGLLRSANGYSIIRSSSVVYRQRPGQHYFNCPKQLTKEKRSTKRVQYVVDLPMNSDLYSAKLKHGDIIIVHTDGFSDNVFPEEMLQVTTAVTQHMESVKNDANLSINDVQAQGIADHLVLTAKQYMISRRKASPFQREALRHREPYWGGKPDDVTVLVVIVQENV
ncbi:hypothetical protein FISHEDRAFT_77610 [Fistulina hepatica ATCC 64428]|uniref:Protein phosphatase n=1 Tax=Fistulina hepatica ATCC 64428 TaxID=1128425 RepID=A0A0D7A0U4_9AGAR|nr:hypothetical protein FISHEDRAFT_77610 [Fistulina hepatica ATCC 64428]